MGMGIGNAIEPVAQEVGKAVGQVAPTVDSPNMFNANVGGKGGVGAVAQPQPAPGVGGKGGVGSMPVMPNIGFVNNPVQGVGGKGGGGYGPGDAPLNPGFPNPRTVPQRPQMPVNNVLKGLMGKGGQTNPLLPRSKDMGASVTTNLQKFFEQQRGVQPPQPAPKPQPIPISRPQPMPMPQPKFGGLSGLLNSQPTPDQVANSRASVMFTQNPNQNNGILFGADGQPVYSQQADTAHVGNIFNAALARKKGGWI